MTPSKDQTWESWTLEKAKRCKQNEFVIQSKNNNRKSPKSRENYDHSGTGSLQDTKQTWKKIELPHDILSLKQQAQSIEKNIEAVRE
jgi:hypothetical protein